MGSTKVVSQEAFHQLVDRRIRGLLRLAALIGSGVSGPQCFTRPLLGGVLSEALQLEELLDSYGARHNRRWHLLRQEAAALKLFSNVGYILQHILHFLPTYRLLPLQQDFPAAARQALEFTCRILAASARRLLHTACELELQPAGEAPALEQFADDLPDGRLAPDRESHKTASPEETVVYLATAFLNLAEEARFIHVAEGERAEGWADLIPDPISEERLRSLEQKFHNLQSLYDTRISDSGMESLDERLPVLRGHISVTYHLLETATAFAHYCERHILSLAPRAAHTRGEIVDAARLLEVLMRFSLAFASRYILVTRSLCHDMLKAYAVQDRIVLPVPRYRGFHVRPSTLVARIVGHYGSEVTMELEGESYNAAVTLDLFRANEKINARKKHRIAEEAHEVLAVPGAGLLPAAALDGVEVMAALVRGVIQTLFAGNRLVLYERDVTLEGLQRRADENREEFVTRALVHLLTLGKIDVNSELSVSFAGDRRVLEDIRLLAEKGYGEDDFGNNLPLPERLAYLRK
jgi:phosphotransferase system HPr-like phosphotransfer protein